MAPLTDLPTGSLVLRGGRVCQPSGVPGEPADVVVDGGAVARVAPAGTHPAGSANVLDATGALVLPGFVDIQVHFRTPGATDSEDLASGAAAAAAGGVTACLMMANTVPPVDSVAAVRELRQLAAGLPADLVPSACVTVGRAGERLVDMAALYEAGVRVFTDDGDAVADADVLAAAFRATTELPGAVISQHAEDPTQIDGGVINAGPVADRLGVRGRPASAEHELVARDLELARETGGRYHLLHTSTAEAVHHVLTAKRIGVRATAEVTPQHLVLTEDDVEALGTTGKMNPPLRRATDTEALTVGLQSGAIDAVATDHAPHSDQLKALPLADAPPGMTGVETAASVVWTHLVSTGRLSVGRFVQVMSSSPARIASFTNHGRYIAPGAPANLVVFDPTATWTVDAQRLHSKSHNSPWHGRTLTGQVRHTVLGGQVIYSDGQVLTGR